MAQKQFVIGIGGVATVGKDTLCEALMFRLFRSGISSHRIALADKLKEETRQLILDKYSIDILNCTPQEKELVRPELVEFARERRIATQGRYWTNYVDSQLSSIPQEVIIVPDIRYANYESDEAFWVHNKKGFLIHLSRFSYDDKGNKVWVQPANTDEAENDPKIQALADFCLAWETRPKQDLNQMYGGFLDMVVACTNVELQKLTRRSVN